MTSETSEITIFVRFHLTLRYLMLTPGMRPLSNEGSPPRLHLHPAIPHQLELLKICCACFYNFSSAKRNPGGGGGGKFNF